MNAFNIEINDKTSSNDRMIMKPVVVFASCAFIGQLARDLRESCLHDVQCLQREVPRAAE